MSDIAISWGPWKYGGGNGMRVGIDYSWSKVTASSNSATITWKFYTQNQYRYNDNHTMNFSGNYSGSSTASVINRENAGVVKERATRTYTYSYPSSSRGKSPGSVNVRARITGTYNGITPEQSRTVSIPARPYSNPAAPSNLVGTRVTDNQINLSWTNHTTTAAPYTSLTLRRRAFTGPNLDPGAWVTVSTLSGSPTSFQDTGTVANTQYEYQIRSNNSAGSSSYVSSSYVYSAPAAPSSVTASMTTDGIQVSWVRNSFYNEYVKLERSVNGGTWSVVSATLPPGTLGYLDSAYPAGAVTYRVSYLAPNGAQSPFGTSNTVTSIVPPFAPTLLYPVGVTVDLNNDLTFTWTHNHGGDGAAQTAFSLNIFDGPTPIYNSGTISSSVSSFTLPGGLLPNGLSYQWRVQTQGIASAGFGPESAPATFNTANAPHVSIISPEVPVGTLPIEVEWSYSQDDGHPQTAYRISLYQILGSQRIPLQRIDGLGPATSDVLTFPLEDGQSYLIEVSARSSSGIWSEIQEVDFTLELLPPADAHLIPTYDECTGTMDIELSVDEAVPGVSDDVEYVDVQRRIGSTGEWLTIAAQVRIPYPDSLTILDTTPITNGMNEYRLIVTAVNGVGFISPPILAPGTDGRPGAGLWVFVSYGEAFQNIVRLSGDPSITSKTGRNRAVQPFLGHAIPRLRSGENTSREVSVSGAITWPDYCTVEEENGDECNYDSPRDDWEAASLTPGIVCYRDYTGRRMFGAIGDVDISSTSLLTANVSFTVTEAQYTERVGYVQFDTEDDEPADNDGDDED